MGATTELRKLITAKLNELPGKTYHKTAERDAAYPYKVYSLERINTGDLSRLDYSLCVDLWDRAQDWKTVESVSDELTALFNAANLPQDRILPTFFREDSYPVDDSDKEIQHQQLHFTVQLYINDNGLEGEKMSEGKECIYVRCPYYRREDRKRIQIKCEGLVDGTHLYQRFGSVKSLLQHKERYCKSYFNRCPLAAALDRKYDFKSTSCFGTHPVDDPDKTP